MSCYLDLERKPQWIMYEFSGTFRYLWDLYDMWEYMTWRNEPIDET